MKKLTIFTDGGARGNPGPAGIGVFIKDVGEYKEYIGETTNNQAEYKAVILALEKAKETEADELDFYLDSELVVKQLKQEYKVKNSGLIPLCAKIWDLSASFKKVSFTHIRRDKNKEADRLVNEAIDEHLQKNVK